MAGFFSAARETLRTPSFDLNFEISQSRRKVCDYHVPGDVGGEQSAKGEKTDDINRAGRRAQNGR